MARKSRKPDIDEVETNLMPMVDIVFNLLVFFLCATRFRAGEGLIQCFLPKNRGQGTGTPQIDLNEVRVKLLWYGSSGTPTTQDEGFVVLKIGDQPFNSPGDLEREEVPEVHEVWRRLHQKLLEFKAGYQGHSERGLPVIIDARKQVPTRYVVSALNEVVRAGITDVTFAAPEIEY